MDIGCVEKDVFGDLYASYTLASIVARRLDMSMEKSTFIRTGNWESFPLTPSQITYAADDAYVSLVP